MARRKRRGTAIDGIVLLDKAAGMTSNAALQAVRRLFDARKAGHAGTLDPFATGMLPVCFGEATKYVAEHLDAEKGYLARAALGARTETGDPEGRVLETAPVPALNARTVEGVLARFLGDQEQVPPMYSALKHQGRRLHDLARQGRVVERAPRRIRITTLELLEITPQALTVRIACSKGTYVRVLIEDIARALATVGHTSALRRERVGAFGPEQMVSLDTLEALTGERRRAWLLPVDAGLTHLPRLELSASETRELRHGRPVRPEACPPAPGRCRLYAPDGGFLGLGDLSEGGCVRPRRLLALPPAAGECATEEGF